LEAGMMSGLPDVHFRLREVERWNYQAPRAVTKPLGSEYSLQRFPQRERIIF
jgi:hypothetical protein